MAGGAGDRLFHVGEVEHRAGGRLELELHKAGDDSAHVEDQPHHAAGRNIQRAAADLGLCRVGDGQADRRLNALDRAANRCVHLAVQGFDRMAVGA